MINWLQPVTLYGTYVKLEPLSMDHNGDLMVSVQDGELWELEYTVVPEPAKMAEEILRRIASRESGITLPFAVVDMRTGEAVGMTTLAFSSYVLPVMSTEATSRRTEIGSTWYRKRVQRTAVNTESKLLLLTHAFETLSCIAVEFRTSSLNHRSQRAIERLGAKLDGVLRSHMILPNGVLRDTCVYSIVAAEWPAVRADLQRKLDG